MDTPTIVVLSLSVVATAFIWRDIYRSSDPAPMKWALAVAVAIPVIGPAFWPFLSMPPRRPEKALEGPYQGPLAPLPKRPPWLAFSYRALIIILACGAVVVHLIFLSAVMR